MSAKGLSLEILCMAVEGAAWIDSKLALGACRFIMARIVRGYLCARE